MDGKKTGTADDQRLRGDLAAQKNHHRHHRHGNRLGVQGGKRLQNCITEDRGGDGDDRVAEKDCRKQPVRLVEKLADNLALRRMFLSQTAKLQFAEREQGDLCP